MNYPDSFVSNMILLDKMKKSMIKTENDILMKGAPE